MAWGVVNHMTFAFESSWRAGEHFRRGWLFAATALATSSRGLRQGLRLLPGRSQANTELLHAHLIGPSGCSICSCQPKRRSLRFMPLRSCHP